MTRQQLLDSIHPGMKLDKDFFLRVYGYEITWPGSADEAVSKLEEVGCSKAREYYNKTVSEYQRKRDEELRPIARQIRKRWEADWEKLVKGSEERRRQKEIELLKQKRQLLLRKLQILNGK